MRTATKEDQQQQELSDLEATISRIQQTLRDLEHRRAELIKQLEK